MHFAETTVARYSGEIARHRFLLPEAERIPAVIEQGEALGAVDRALDGRAYLLGDELSAADIMMGYRLERARARAKGTSALPML